MSFANEVACDYDEVVLGMDVGTRNLGLVVITAGSLELLFCKTVSLGGARNQSNDAELAMLMRELFTTMFGDTWVPSRFVVEQNTQTRWQCAVECLALGYWAGRGARVHHVSPCSVKTAFRGLGRNGHAQNKKDAMHLVRDTWDYGVTQDHEADALLVAMFVLMSEERGYAK